MPSTNGYMANKYYQSMKRFTTVVCCLIFMVCGAFMALMDAPVFPGHQVAIASPPMHLQPLQGLQNVGMPLVTQSSQGTSTESVKTDTVVLRDTVFKVKPKYVYVQKRRSTTDTVYCPMPIPGKLDGIAVKNKISGDREEQSHGELQNSKRSSISLTVDGQVVYSSGNDNHSAEEGR